MLCRADTPPLPRPSLAWRPPMLVVASLLWHLAAFSLLIFHPEAWREVVLALLANHLVLSIPGMNPQSRALGPNIRRLPGTLRAGEVALTLDDGPDPEVTPQVLEILAAHGVRASFFLIGCQAEAHPELVRRIVEQGHLVENHTFHHRHTFAFNIYPFLRREIVRAQEALTRLAGRAPAYFRAPAGMHNLFLSAVLARLGIFFVSWTWRGYDTFERDPAKVLERLLGKLEAGDILLLHDGNAARTKEGQPVVLVVLPLLLEELDRRRLKAVPLPEPSSLPQEATSLFSNG